MELFAILQDLFFILYCTILGLKSHFQELNSVIRDYMFFLSPNKRTTLNWGGGERFSTNVFPQSIPLFE